MKTLLTGLIAILVFVWLCIYCENNNNEHRYNCWMIENEMRQLEVTEPQYIALADTFDSMYCKPSLISKAKDRCEYLEFKIELYTPGSTRSNEILFEMIDLGC